MNNSKRRREVISLAKREVGKSPLAPMVEYHTGSHPKLVLTTRDGRHRCQVTISGTPSVKCWLRDILRDLRHTLRRLEALAANDRRAPGC